MSAIWSPNCTARSSRWSKAGDPVAASPILCPRASRLKLSPEQLATLRDLRRKKAGETVGWISIALARSLTDLDLAEREPSGWRITAAGEAVLDGKQP
jgi:hypothetical protein